jgi:hypothetical protein
MFNMTHLIVYEVLMLVSGLFGYYLGSRGMSGMTMDLANVKADLASLKNKLFPSTPAQPPVSTTVAGT